MARTIDAIVREHLGTQAMVIAQLQAQIEELNDEIVRLKAAQPQPEDADGRDPR